jgi:hypothetical protein
MPPILLNRPLISVLLFFVSTPGFSQCFVQATAVNALCNGACNGMAYVDSVNGQAPFTFSWSPVTGTNDTITGLCAGTYTVVMTDNLGCTDDFIVSIFQPTALNVFRSSNPSTNCTACSGSAVAIAGGGTAPYSYSWSTGATTTTISNLCPGTYTITATDNNGCTKVDSVVVGGNQPLTASTSGNDNTSCGTCNGDALAQGYGGVAPYTYSWNNGQTGDFASGLCGGTFTVTVTDNAGCSTTRTVAIGGQSIPITLFPSSNANSSCTPCDGMAFISALGGVGPYTYSWNTNETTASIGGLCAGSYDVIVTDNNGCTNTANVSVNGPTGPTVSLGSNPASCSSCPDGDAYVNPSGGQAPYTYSWSTGSTDLVIAGLLPATYTICVTDANMCESCDTIQVDFLTMTGIPEAVTSFSIFPNPAADMITVTGEPEGRTLDITVVNLLGDELLGLPASSLPFSIPVADLPPGIYFIRITDDGRTVTKRFVKD